MALLPILRLGKMRVDIFHVFHRFIGFNIKQRVQRLQPVLIKFVSLLASTPNSIICGRRQQRVNGAALFDVVNNYIADQELFDLH